MWSSSSSSAAGRCWWCGSGRIGQRGRGVRGVVGVLRGMDPVIVRKRSTRTITRTRTPRLEGRHQLPPHPITRIIDQPPTTVDRIQPLAADHRQHHTRSPDPTQQLLHEVSPSRDRLGIQDITGQWCGGAVGFSVPAACSTSSSDSECRSASTARCPPRRPNSRLAYSR